MQVKLTKRSVDGATSGGSDRAMIFDTEIPGFALRVSERGVKTFVLRYTRGVRSCWATIGRFGVITPDEARREAIRLRGVVASGGDPAAERAAARAIPTLAEFAERYLAEHSSIKKKPRSNYDDRRILARYLLPALGKLRVSDISVPDVQRLHHQMRSTPTTANRTIVVLSTMLNFAERWGVRANNTNPVRQVQKFPEKRRERFLTPDELRRLGDAIRQSAANGMNPAVIACVRLLILTGCRCGEIQNLKWAHVDLAAGCLRLPDSKTGAKFVPLGQPAVDFLRAMPRLPDNPFVCPGLKRGAAFVGLNKPWREIRALASLTDLRIHDLRHAFATTGLHVGESLALVGRILGHSTTTMTERYAHLAPDPARAAADRIATAQVRMLDGDGATIGTEIRADLLGRRRRPAA